MRPVRLIAVVLLPLLLAGCSVAMSANRSSYKGDPAMIQPGAERAMIESTFGPPNMTAAMEGGKLKAVYKIDPDAHTAGAKGVAVAGHLIADVLTLGLWEILGTPLELAAQDKFTNYIVVYGPDSKVQTVETLR
jgi:hypothetical protein